jgi:drug/metabolite transporter (DMT)-like permease
VVDLDILLPLKKRPEWAKLNGMVRLYFLLPIGMLAVATASIFIKLCDAPALAISAYRIVLASLLLAPFAGYRRVWREWRKEDLGWLILSGILLSLHFVFWIGSLKYTSVASSVVLVNAHPIFVGIGGWIFLKERASRNLIFGLCFSVLGSLLISYGDMAISQRELAGDGLALLGAMTVSGYFLVGRKMRQDRNLLSYIFPVYSAAGLALVLICLAFRTPFFGYSSSTYLYLFLLALVPQLIGHTTFNWALRYLPASMVAITILGEPVGSIILACSILGESLTLWKILGGLLIFSGILIALKKR